MTKRKSAPTKANPAKASKNAKASKPSTVVAGPKKPIIFKFICEQHIMGIQEVSKLQAALACGFQNPRSAGFSKPLKELTSEGLIDKGSKKDFLTLTQQGIDNMPDDLEKNPDPSAARDRFIEFLDGKVKAGADKIRRVWDILADREKHAIKDIAKELGYNNHRSFGNTKIIACMKQMGLVEDAGKGYVKFTDKVRF